MVSKKFKTKEEAKEWTIAKAKAMLNKKYNKSVGIGIVIRKWKEKEWGASVSINHIDDSMSKDRYWYHSIKFKDRRIGPRNSRWYFTKGDALKSLKSMPRVKKCLEKKKQRK